MMPLLIPICWILGHDWSEIYDLDIIGQDEDGDPIFGPEYVDHIWCERCYKIERA
jgi:hypothetical protein